MFRTDSEPTRAGNIGRLGIDMRVVRRALRPPQLPLSVLSAFLAVLLLGSVGCGRDSSARNTRVATSPLTNGPSVAGESAQYVYDAAGNILQIASAAAAGLSIVDFQPRTGGVGEIVTVYGAGFSPMPSLNTVLLNSVAAPVLAATASELSFAVPVGASTGPISVTSGTSTATSQDSFTVVDGVVISDFTPKMGAVGTTLTIAGYNFDPIPVNDSVFVGSGSAPVTGASLTSLLATVGATATSGKVSVTTFLGTGTSVDDFFLLPGTYSQWDIEYTGRAVAGSATTVTMNQAGQAGLVLFDGTQGQFGSLYVSGVTFSGSTQITVYAPSGTSIFSASGITASQEYKFELPALPTSGTYTVAVQPAATSTGKLDLQVFQDASGVLQAGTASSMTLGRGQNGRFTFTANVGDSLSLACTGIATIPTGASASLSIYRPDGTYVWGGSVSAPTSWQLPQMPVTGTYTMLVRPSGTAGASLTFLLSQPNVGTIVVDGDAAQFTNSSPGQAGRYMFVGNAGDLLGLGVSALTTNPSGGYVSFDLYRPDGSYMLNYRAYQPNNCQLPQLPTTGTYTISIQPSGTVTATVTFLLSRPIIGTIATDGTATIYQTTRVGQAGRYTFTGAAGQRFTMQVTTGSGYSGQIGVTVYQPSGASTAYAALYSSTDQKIDLGALPASGTYTAVVIPSGAALGTTTLRLVSGASDTLTVGADPKTLTLGTAQNGRYTFSGTAGDLIGFGVTAISTNPANGNVWFYVYNPNGTELSHWSTSIPSSWQLPQLPTTGTYTLSIQPPGTASASVTLLLSQAITGTIATDGSSTTYQTTRVGQSGRYTFAGTAGQRFTMQATAGSLMGTMQVAVYQPSGASIGSVQLYSNYDKKIDLGTLPTSGIYTVIVIPTAVTTGQVQLRLVSYASGTLTVGDSAKTLALTMAQNGWYTFTGNIGDLLSLNVTALATTPSGQTVYFYVYKPDGSSLWSSYTSVPSSWQVPQLPTAGTYAVSVKPQGTAAATLALQLARR